MSLMEKILWSAMTFALAFALISLLDEDLQPQRFLFGIPFTCSLFVVIGAFSILTGGAVMHGVAAVVSEQLAQWGWWLLGLVMVLRCLASDFIDKNVSRSEGALVSVLICGGAAFFLLVDAYQRSVSWPRFDVPELGQVSRRSVGRTKIRADEKNRINWFGAFSCCVAAYGFLSLVWGLRFCMQDSNLPMDFFISELGIRESATVFKSTLLMFGLTMIPFFLNFVLCFSGMLPPEAVKFALGGCCAVSGVIGIGIWDLHNPLHYFAIAVWLWPLAAILDQFVPTPRGFIQLRFPTWIVKFAMAGYVVSMIVFPFSAEFRVVCIWMQRLVVLTTFIWLALLWKTMFVESVGLGAKFNLDPQE